MFSSLAVLDYVLPIQQPFCFDVAPAQFPNGGGRVEFSLGWSWQSCPTGLAGAQTSFFGFSGWGFETPYRWGYHDI